MTKRIKLSCILCQGNGRYTIISGPDDQTHTQVYLCDHKLQNLDTNQQMALMQVWPGSVQARILCRQIEHFVKVLQIDGLGPKIIERLVDDRTLRDPADIYALTAADIVRARKKKVLQ